MRRATLALAMFAASALSCAAQPGSQDGGPPEDRSQPVTLAQFQAHERDRVMRLDADHDGRVSLAEWSAGRSDHHGYGGGEGHGGWDPARMFDRLDLNHDGYVTPDEIDAASARRFARMDANHDGVVTPDERDAMRHGGGERGERPPPE